MNQILTLILLLTTLTVSSQVSDTIYYNNHPKQIKSIDNKIGDTYVGEYRMWYPNGQLKMKGNFKDNTWTGIWEYFNPNGKLHKTGEYKEGYGEGVWKMYDIHGKEIARKKYENRILIDIKYLGGKGAIYFEYDYEVKESEEVFLNKFFGRISQDAFKLFEPPMKANIAYIENNPLSMEFGAIANFVTIWAGNCPYLSKTEIHITKFVADWTRLEQSYKYAPRFSTLYLVGVCAYLLESKDKKYDKLESTYRAVESMVRGYKAILLLDPDSRNKKLDQLLKKYEAGELKKFIKQY